MINDDNGDGVRLNAAQTAAILSRIDAEHLWFQRLLEARLHVETLRRAIEAGHVPADTTELCGFEAIVDCWGHAPAYASYRVETDDDRPHHIVHYEVEYTLSEVMRLAMTEPE